MQDDPFEFSQEQNKILLLLARLMKYVAVLFIFLGIVIGIFCGFTIVKHPMRGISFLLQTILAIVFGVWTNNVSYSFKQIAETTGHDMEILMEAFKTLKRVYTLQFIYLVIIALLFLAVLIMNTLTGFQAMSLFKTS
jgi:hypothetical protein